MGEGVGHDLALAAALQGVVAHRGGGVQGFFHVAGLQDLPLIELAKSGMGIVQISKGSVARELAAGELEVLLDDYEGVNHDGSRPATWVMFPAQRELTRTQVFIAALTRYLRELSE